VPDAGEEFALPEHFSRNPEQRSEGRERRIRHGELFVRSGDERERRVALEDDLTGLQVEGDGGGSRRGDVGHRKCALEPELERRRGCGACRSGRGGRKRPSAEENQDERAAHLEQSLSRTH
jgi:hypothetical protein